ncbi:MAG: glycosyltransferase family 39 protein [Chloroflexi bacterium]|nr:glycosyltransferase family 39 protein [Chloroflexota bacterium]
MTSPTPKSEIRNPKSALWPMTAVLLIAAALRFIGVVHQSPPGLAHDEVANWLISRLILSGEHAIYITRAYGHEAGFHYWQTLMVALIGDNPLALHVASAYMGVLGVAVAFALARQLFGWRVGLMAAGITAVLFWPVFYGRLALRAISLPVFSGLSAYFWWRAWREGDRETRREGDKETRREGDKETRRQGDSRSPGLPVSPSPPLPLFLLSGLFAGLSLHTYLAARAAPIFYGLFVLYLALFHWPELKARWRGVALFAVVFTAVVAPLAWFLWQNPGAEFRVAEVAAPLNALRAGDVGPVLQNALKIAGMFGLTGVAIWREGIPGQPVFGPLLALCFYGGVLLSAWRWRDARYAFLLLWAGTAVLPSVVTINAPSTIRIVNILPVLGLFPALFIHNLPLLSTVYPRLSTGAARFRPVLLTILFAFYVGRTAWSIFVIWSNGGDIPFVWQAALRETAVALDGDFDITAAAIGGWSPDTLDGPTMALYLRRSDLPLSHFGVQAGEDIIYTLLIPNRAPTGVPGSAAGDARHVFHPTALPLHPHWQSQLKAWGAATQTNKSFTQHVLPGAPIIQPQFPAAVTFGVQLRFLGHDLNPDCSPTPSPCLITYWQVSSPITQPLRLFIHALDESGEIVAEDYRWDTAEPQQLWQPHWQPGDLIMQIHPLPLDNAAQLRLGLFDPYSCAPGPCQNVPTETGEKFILLGAKKNS